MLKLRKIGVALTLALMLSLTLLGSGAFAQSVNHSSSNVATTIDVATGTLNATQLANPQQINRQLANSTADRWGPGWRGGWRRGWWGGRGWRRGWWGVGWRRAWWGGGWGWHRVWRCGWRGWGWHRFWRCGWRRW